MTTATGIEQSGNRMRGRATCKAGEHNVLRRTLRLMGLVSKRRTLSLAPKAMDLGSEAGETLVQPTHRIIREEGLPFKDLAW